MTSGKSTFKHVDILIMFLDDVLGIKGEVGEFGCRSCGTTGRLAQYLIDNNSDKRVYAFDTFEGFPYDDIYDGEIHRKGQMSTDYQLIIERSRKFDNIILVKGMFENTLNDIDIQYCFAFIDPDVYQATSYVYNYLKDRMPKGAIMAFHDYGSKHCPGVKKVVDEEVDRNNFEIIFSDKTFETRLAVFRRK